MAKQTTQESESKGSSSITGRIKEILAIIATLTGLIVVAKGQLLDDQLKSLFSSTQFLLVVFSILLSMLIAYLVAWMAQHPEEVVKKLLGQKEKLLAIFASIVAGLFMSYYVSTVINPEIKGWGGLIQTSIGIGFISGLILGIAAYILVKFFWDKMLEPVGKYTESIGRMGKIAGLVVLSIIITLPILLSIKDLFTPEILDGIKNALTYIRLPNNSIVFYLFMGIASFAVVALVLWLLHQLFKVIYRIRLNTREIDPKPKEKRKKQANHKRNSPSRK